MLVVRQSAVMMSSGRIGAVMPSVADVIKILDSSKSLVMLERKSITDL
jgi:hypothetical protein